MKTYTSEKVSSHLILVKNGIEYVKKYYGMGSF